ncbi:hypothetical protein CREGCYN_14830 [Synechococcus sp. M16CYN]
MEDNRSLQAKCLVAQRFSYFKANHSSRSRALDALLSTFLSRLQKLVEDWIV